MSIYRINAIIGHIIRTLQVAAWSDEDAMHRASKRLTSEGHPLFTLTILERKPL